MIGQIGEPNFFPALLDTLGRYVGFDWAEVYSFSRRSAPRNIGYAHLHAQECPQFPNYRGLYVHDPLYRAYLDRAPAGLYTQSELTRRYPHNAVYKQFYRESAIGEDLEYLIPSPDGSALVIWLCRFGGSAAFGPREVRHLVSYAAPLVATVQKHLAWNIAAREPGPGMDWAEWELTQREVEVLDQLLAGTAPKVIGRMLGISQGTVCLHRKSIYRKLGIHSRAELFALACGTGTAALAR
jgi:DNA-binding CsgD family transcriptional regulator